MSKLEREGVRVTKKELEDYPFGYKDAEEHLVKVAPKPLKVKGVRFIKFVYVKISDVIADFQNPARENSTDQTKVVNIQRLLKNGMYRGHFFIPPVITTEGVLLEGHHRIQAHKGEELEYIWVAICECENDLAIFDYRFESNLTEDVHAKMIAKNGDLIGLLWSGISEGTLSGKEKEIDNYLIRSKKGTNDKLFIKREIFFKLGQPYNAYRNHSRSEIAQEYQKESEGKFVDFQQNIKIGATLANDSRLLNRILPVVTRGDDINCIFKVNDTESKEHYDEERVEMKSNLSLEKLYNDLKPFVHAYENGMVGKLIINTPRLWEDDNKWELNIEPSLDTNNER